MIPSPVSVIGSVSDSTFNPKWISNLQFWLDAADASTMYSTPTGSILVTHSGSVGRWEDKSGNNWHAYQFTASRQPRYITSSINNLSTLNFIRTNSGSFEMTSSAYSILNNKTEFTFVFVSEITGSSVQQTINGISTPADTGANLHSIIVRGDGVLNPSLRRSSADAIFQQPVFRSFSYNRSGSLCSIIHSVKYNASSSFLYVNGVEVPSTSSLFASYSGSTQNANTLRFNIGCNISNASFIQGKVLEIMSFDKILNGAERRALERYFVRKWNIRSYDQKTSSSIDIFSSLDAYLDANNPVSNPGSGTTWTDLSGNGRNATLYNGASFTTSESISFVNCDGTNDYLDLVGLNYTSQDFSISSWLRIASSDYGVEDVFLYFTGYFDTNGYNLYTSAGAFIGNTFFITNQSGANQISSTIVNSLPREKWFFLTLTRSSARAKIYVNGVHCTNGYANHVNPSSGAYNFTMATNFVGYAALKIGALIAHTKILSDQEVLELYNFTKTKYNIID